jgi:tetratricopeptide (TPR) repeat protein
MRWLLWALLLTTGCATAVRSRPAAVPFIAQAPEQCGPAALAMVAAYYGQPLPPETIAAEIYLPSIHGVLTAELADYARRFQFWTRQYRGSWADLRQKTRAAIPLIVLGRFGSQWHYFVVLDVGEEILAHSDSRPHVRFRREDFQRWWNRAHRWTLLVCPPERATWKLSTDEHNDLGVFLEQLGRLDEAARHYEAAGHDFNLGNIRLKQGRYADAAALFARLPDHPDALNNLAWTYHEMGERLEEAAALCQRAIALRPAQRAYYLDTLGSVRLKQNRVAEAIAAFEEALAATTERQAALRAAIQQRLAAARRR